MMTFNAIIVEFKICVYLAKLLNLPELMLIAGIVYQTVTRRQIRVNFKN